MEYEANISPELKLQILSRDAFKCTNCAAGVPDIYLGVQSLYKANLMKTILPI